MDDDVSYHTLCYALCDEQPSAAAASGRQYSRRQYRRRHHCVMHA